MFKTVTLTLTLAAALLAGACTDAGDDGEYLFGLTADDVLSLRDAYDPEAADEVALSRMTAPFECANFGDTCRFLGEDGAYQLAEREVDMALEGAPAAEIDAMIDETLRAAADSDEPQVWSTDTAYRYPSTDVRVKVVFGTVYPLIGKAHSKCFAKYQERPRDTWRNRDADMLYCRTESHTYWSYTIWGDTTSGTTDAGARSKRLYGVNAVEAKREHDKPEGGWGFNPGQYIDYNNRIVQTRAYVEVEPRGWSTTRSYELQ